MILVKSLLNRAVSITLLMGMSHSPIHASEVISASRVECIAEPKMTSCATEDDQSSDQRSSQIAQMILEIKRKGRVIVAVCKDFASECKDFTFVQLPKHSQSIYESLDRKHLKKGVEETVPKLAIATGLGAFYEWLGNTLYDSLIARGEGGGFDELMKHAVFNSLSKMTFFKSLDPRASVQENQRRMFSNHGYLGKRAIYVIVQIPFLLASGLKKYSSTYIIAPQTKLFQDLLRNPVFEKAIFSPFPEDLKRLDLGEFYRNKIENPSFYATLLKMSARGLVYGSVPAFLYQRGLLSAHSSLMALGTVGMYLWYKEAAHSIRKHQKAHNMSFADVACLHERTCDLAQRANGGFWNNTYISVLTNRLPNLDELTKKIGRQVLLDRYVFGYYRKKFSGGNPLATNIFGDIGKFPGTLLKAILTKQTEKDSSQKTKKSFHNIWAKSSQIFVKGAVISALIKLGIADRSAALAANFPGDSIMRAIDACEQQITAEELTNTTSTTCPAGG